MPKIHLYCVEDLESYRWRDVAPLSDGERQEVLEKYGEYCFLDPERLKFPICNKDTGCISCKGLKAAHYRADQLYNRFKTRNRERAKYYKDIAEKAVFLAEFFDCEWIE
jgi:hypothetical protein